MEKKLTLDKPLLRGRLHIAYPMISFMQHPQGKDFLYNYFLNLECHKFRNDINLCYVSQEERQNTSWIHYLNDYICYPDYLEKENVIENFCLEIEQNRYICAMLDDYYLPEKLKVKRHYLHINLIYGYNNEKKVFYTYGYDWRERLRVIELPFDALKKGLVFSGVETFKPNFDINFTFDKKHFEMQITDFLESKNSLVSDKALERCGFNKNDFLYGVAVYERITRHIKEIPQSGPDIRNTYMLYEWSKLNWIRLVFLRKNRYYDIPDVLLKQAKEIHNRARAGHYLMLKYACSRNDKLLDKIKDGVQWNRDMTVNLYKDLKIITE